MKQDIEEAFVSLAAAVVEQAMKDYKAAEMRKIKKPRSEKAQKAVEEVRSFFLSNRFSLLSFGIDGSEVIKKLDKELDEWKRRNT